MNCQTLFSRKNKNKYQFVICGICPLHGNFLKFAFIFCGVGVTLPRKGYVL